MAKILYMNKVYSSTYERVGKYVLPNRQVCISVTKPSDFKGIVMEELKPSRELRDAYKSGQIRADEYREVYQREVLDKLDPTEVYEKLKGRVILCWCQPKTFCHRLLVLDWLEKKLGVDIIGSEL